MPLTKNALLISHATPLAPEMERIQHLSLHPYALPLKNPWVAANATLTLRLGTAIALRTTDGLIGWGDCAPLPSTGEAGYRLTHSALQSLTPQLTGQPLAALQTFLAEGLLPEVRWALETALLDNQSQRAGQRLAEWATGQPQSKVDLKPLAISVNAALGTGSESAAQTALKAGFRIAKIKVGVRPVAEEIELLHHLTEATAGQLHFRLDANCAWDQQTARHFLHAITRLPIDGVEEPLHSPSLAALQALQADLPFPLAVDESLFPLGPEAFFSTVPVRRLVLKPARIGGFERTRQLALQAATAGIETVITSVVDTTIGIHAAAHLAATLPPATHGLATSSWLTQDIAPPPRIEHGMLQLAAIPGLGCRQTQALTQGLPVEFAVTQQR